jgi:hypothetical protein
VSRPLGLLPAFVLAAANVTFSAQCRSSLCAQAPPCERLRRSTPGALAPVRVILSRSIHAYPTPSDPLAGTARFHCSAAYTPCIRCTFPPRRPATGSVLLPLILSQHVVLCDSGESNGCIHPVPSPPTLAFVPLVQTQHSHTSRKSVSRGGHLSKLHYVSLALQPADLFTLLTDRTVLAHRPRGFLLPGFRRFGHPLRRRLSLRWQLGNFHRRELHPLDWQLASLRTKAVP